VYVQNVVESCIRASSHVALTEDHAVQVHATSLIWLRCCLAANCALQVYVQDLIRKQGQQLWELLEKQGAVVYVCEDARRMAPGVAAAFQAVAQEWGGRSSSTAASWLGSMREAKRYLEDVWA
jgi:sulfite reductase alpha subunit-like flavoprotein